MGYLINSEFSEPPIKRCVGDGGASGRIYVPKAWKNKYVIVALLTEEQQHKAREVENKELVDNGF